MLVSVPSSRVRLHRVVLVALAGVPVVCALTLWVDLGVGGAPWESGGKPLAPTLLLLALMGVNALVGRARPGRGWGGGTAPDPRKPSP